MSSYFTKVGKSGTNVIISLFLPRSILNRTLYTLFVLTFYQRKCTKQFWWNCSHEILRLFLQQQNCFPITFFDGDINKQKNVLHFSCFEIWLKQKLHQIFFWPQLNFDIKEAFVRFFPPQISKKCLGPTRALIRPWNYGRVWAVFQVTLG